jgi:hypothetical protein
VVLGLHPHLFPDRAAQPLRGRAAVSLALDHVPEAGPAHHVAKWDTAAPDHTSH